MADGGGQHALRYSAFISYSHRDTVFARRLHRLLETYRLPRRLSGDAGAPLGTHRRLRPVFRDRDELAAAPDLTEAVQEAIAQSSYLIVVCSANSAGSHWVGLEVALFRALRGPRAILVVLAEGSSPDQIDAVLREEAPGHSGAQPLAADFRREGDGARLALLKLVAVLAGVRLAELVQRDAQRRLRVVSLIGAGALAGLAVMTVLTVVAVQARHAAERERARGESLINYMLSDLRRALKGAGRLDLLDIVNRGVVAYFGAQDLSRMNDAELADRARLLQAMGEDESARGKLDQARVWFEQAARTTAARLAAAPDALERIFDHSQSEYWVGFIDWRTGDTASAERHFRAYATLVDRLVRAEPANTRWLIERGYADSNLGMFLMRHALDLDHAEPLFAAALAALQDAAAKSSYDADLQVQIADGYVWLGGVERLRRNYARARAYHVQARAVLDAVLARDGRDAEARSTIVSSDLGLARIDSDNKSFNDAYRDFDEGRAMADALVRGDPQNMYAREQLRAYDLFRARTEMAQGEPPAPRDAVLARLDDCRPEHAIFSNSELTDFCAVLLARRLGQFGKAGAAEAALLPVRKARAAMKDALSNRWGLDFAAEIELVTSPEARKAQ